MTNKILLFLSISTALVFSASFGASAQTSNTTASTPALKALDASLPGTLINNPYAIKWRTEGDNKKEEIVESKGAPGGMAYRVKVKKSNADYSEIATRIPMTTDIPAGDVIMVSFWARAAKTPKGQDTGPIVVALQKTAEPNAVIFEKNIELDKKWKIYSAAGKANQYYSADKTSVNFNLAKAKQTIEFGQFYVMNLGPNGDASKYIKE